MTFIRVNISRIGLLKNDSSENGKKTHSAIINIL